MSKYSRQHGNKDHLHDSVRRWFQAAKFDWQDTHGVGGGFPDGVAGYQDFTALVEIKAQGETLNDAQRKFFIDWRGPKLIVYPGTCSSADKVAMWLAGAQVMRTEILYGAEGVTDYCSQVIIDAGRTRLFTVIPSVEPRWYPWDQPPHFDTY